VEAAAFREEDLEVSEEEVSVVAVPGEVGRE
jgi:hypothetical protein